MTKSSWFVQTITQTIVNYEVIHSWSNSNTAFTLDFNTFPELSTNLFHFGGSSLTYDLCEIQTVKSS